MNHSEEDLEQFYEQLRTVVDSIKKRNLISTMGGFIANVITSGSKHQGFGLHGLGERNSNGEHLLTFSGANQINDNPQHIVLVSPA
ncbi:hypothetical protein PoB_000102100 [Plakobranchus ocellatus]|uniref:Uncharacterized protein n=1 Tax=Plakobranchus ocellatus TaxID=259542 RepID=A0AAV3XWR5_9GAST|nr:hypothetical protein PoB_000102100 [Plakobranchus ocellatus]